MFDWITGLIRQGSYLGILGLMFLENVFPPIPSELIMPLGGFVADQGRLNFGLVVLAGVVGSVAGQVLLYYLGRKLGKDRVKRWVDDHGCWVATTSEELQQAEDWFHRHGRATVFFCRLIPGVRSLISIPAGLVEMPLLQFVLYTAAGTTLWTGALAYLGKLLGQNYAKVEEYLNPVTYLVVGAMVLGYFWKVYRCRQNS